MLNKLKALVQRYREKRASYAELEIKEFSHSPRPKTKIIVVCNQKGGCGKTTTVVNLSACLAKKGRRVLMVDLDPQAHASLGLGVEVDNLRWTVYDVLIHNIDLEKTIIPTSVDNLFLVPANHLLSGAQIELANMMARESILRIALNKLALHRQYDYYIIDTSPTLNLVTLNGLVAASSVLIPIQTHYYSLEGMKELFSTIDIVQERLNADLQILGVLPTIFDGRVEANNVILGELREFFGNLLLKTIIHNNSKLLEAPRYKKPVASYAPDSRGARDYLNLAQEIEFLFNETKIGERIQ